MNIYMYVCIYVYNTISTALNRSENSLQGPLCCYAANECIRVYVAGVSEEMRKDSGGEKCSEMCYLERSS